jgi:hypothetical protein
MFYFTGPLRLHCKRDGGNTEKNGHFKKNLILQTRILKLPICTFKKLFGTITNSEHCFIYLEFLCGGGSFFSNTLLAKKRDTFVYLISLFVTQ